MFFARNCLVCLLFADPPLPGRPSHMTSHLPPAPESGDVQYTRGSLSFTLSGAVRREVGEALYAANEQEANLAEFVCDTLLKVEKICGARAEFFCSVYVCVIHSLKEERIKFAAFNPSALWCRTFCISSLPLAPHSHSHSHLHFSPQTKKSGGR